MSGNAAVDRGVVAVWRGHRQRCDTGMTMSKLIRKFVLGTASVLALGFAGAALDYAADAGSAANAADMPAASQFSDNLLPSADIWKDDVRWAQVELRDRGLYKGSLDGVLGPATRRALGRFQQNSGIEQTASLDAQTWEALTGAPTVGQGSSLPPGADHAGSARNSFGASDSGR